MAKRARAVYPDTGYVLPNGETIAIVSEEALVDEAVAMLRVAYRLGGIVQVVQDRAKTGVPNEMVTVAAVVQWQDRTDAKAQPEPAVPAQPVRVEEPEEPESDDLEDQYERDDAAAQLRAVAAELGLNVTFAPLDDPEPAELEDQLEREAREVHNDVPIPAGAVVMGAPIGSPAAAGAPTSSAAANGDRDNTHVAKQGPGSSALPFQKGDQPGDPPRPVEGGVDLSEIAHGDASTPPRGVVAAAPPGSSAGIDDGFVAEADEDDSAIPDHMR